MVLLVHPDGQVFIVVEENASAVWPVSVYICGIFKPITLLKGPLLSKWIVLTLDLLHGVELALQILFIKLAYRIYYIHLDQFPI